MKPSIGQSAEGRWSRALRQVTVARLIVMAVRLLGRFFRLLWEMLKRLIRATGFLGLDAFYSIRAAGIDVIYAHRRGSLRLRSYAALIGSIILALPRGLFLFIKTAFELLGESLRRARASFARDAQAAAARFEKKTARPFLVSLFNFVLIILVVLLPFALYVQWRDLDLTKNRILGKTMEAVGSLFSAKDLLEEQRVAEAGDAFSRATQNFIEAKDDLSSMSAWLLEAARFIPNRTARLAGSSRHLLEAGELSARLGEQLTASVTLPVGQDPSVVAFLDHFIATAEKALPEARRLEEELQQVDAESLPDEYREQFSAMSGQAAFISQSLEEAIELARRASSFLGVQMDKRYLLVFQNNAEKRGPGGFVGSFALVDVRRGEIKNLVVPKGGSYDTEAGLSELVAAPEPLRLLNPRWHFWDANWWPDWPTSAEKLMWFYENSNGPSVDGVISLTPSVIERLLGIIGPIDMTAEYGVVITADNFWQVTQTFSEQKPDVTTEPKKIIGDLMTRIMEELPQRLNPEMTMQLIEGAEASLNEKHILAYFTDKELEETVRSFGWSGEIAAAEGDYLMVVDTNIGGQKTDRVIRETIRHEAKILPDGSIIDNLKVIREHTGVKGEVFTGVRNVNWLRVYVPEGSELISATGFREPDAAYFEEADPRWKKDEDLKGERAARIHPASGTKVYSENEKTVFANWSMIDPGETAVLEFTYRLPFSILPPEPTDWVSRLQRFIRTDKSLRYSLLVQKQPGAEKTFFASSVAADWPSVWEYPETTVKENGAWKLPLQPLTTDLVTMILFSH